MPATPKTTSEARPVNDFIEPARWKLLISAVWIAGFLWLFFSQPLPNNSTSEKPIGRLDIWAAIQSDPFSLLHPLDYTWSDQQASFSHLSQRLPHLVTALMIWVSAWGWGFLVRSVLLNHFPLSRSEKLVVDAGIGLSFISLWVLLLGTFGHMNATSLLAPGYTFATATLAWKLFLRRKPAASQTQLPSRPQPASSRPAMTLVDWLLCSGIAIFGLHLFLGSFTPAWDFDVREYHLQGPKEWWQAGHIHALYHNAYTSFPFLSEMLSLLAMIIDADPWKGAISGKATLAAFSILSVVSVFAISSRLFDRRCGLLAALILISTPWLLRISIIAYAESAITFYLIATVMAALRFPISGAPSETRRLAGVIGFLAGSAMSSKYPGIVSVVIPVGCYILWSILRTNFRSRNQTNNDTTDDGQRKVRFSIISTYALGVLLAVSPWLVRNVCDTGNPVYPLVWSVFGGTDWDQSLNEKWKAAHSAPDHHLAAIPQHLKDVALRNDWQNGLLFALAIPVALLMFRRREIKWTILHVTWLLGSWWLLTHRIDRFWVPMIPVLAVIASGTWALSRLRIWHIFLTTAVLVTSLYNYAFCRLDVVGFHVGLSDLSTAAEKRVRDDLRYLNAALPERSRVLMVGEAEVFDCRFETIYNTVFDESIFQAWTCSTKDVLAGTPESAFLPMKPANEIYARLKAEGITHVYVNWLEILRYRRTYGYTPYVTPARFEDLVRNNVLLPGNTTAMASWAAMPQNQQDEVRSWQGSEFLKQPGDALTSRVLYKVNPDFGQPSGK